MSDGIPSMFDGHADGGALPAELASRKDDERSPSLRTSSWLLQLAKRMEAGV